MRSSFVAALLASAAVSVRAQAPNATFIAGLVNTLQANNLTSLIGAVTTIANTTTGQALLGKIASGATYTLLAPDNDAFAGVNPFFGNDPVWLGQALAYHVIPGYLNSAATYPNTTISQTELSDPRLAHLNGAPLSIGFTTIDGVVHIANQNSPSIIRNTTGYGNVTIHIISSVVDLPPSIGALVTLPSLDVASNLTTLVGLLNSYPQILSTVESSNKITVFAPINQAFVDAISSGHLSPSANASTVSALLSNHILNGTLVYTGSAQKNYTSAGGETITIGTGGLTDGSGSVVYYRGEQVANIVAGDIITQNGVVHLIDVVLPHTATNATAASSAYSAALTQPTTRRRRDSRLFGGRY